MITSKKEIIKALLNGEVVGIPTDTVYGFASLEEFSDKIYALKNRDKNKKLISFIDNVKKIGEVDDFSFKELEDICKKYWPGTNTLIFYQNKELNSYRIPDNRTLHEVLKDLDRKILTTSANISGEPPILTPESFQLKFPNIKILVEEIPSKKTNRPSNIFVITKDEINKIR